MRIERLGIIHEVITLLVETLALQMELKPGNAMQCLEEMAVLCREQLSSDLLEPELHSAVESFAEAVMICMSDPPGPPSQQIVECLCEANVRLANSRYVLFALFLSFRFRFMETQSNEDYEAAMAPLDRIIASHFPAKSPNQYFPDALTEAAYLADRRFNYSWIPEHLEEAISRTRAHLISIPLEDPERGDVIQWLEEQEATRLENFGVTHALPEAHPSNPETIFLPPFSHLTASLAEMNALECPSITIEDCFRHLDAVGSMNRITDGTDIDEAIPYCRLLLASFQQRLGVPIEITERVIGTAGNFLHHAFKLTNNPEYLNESIDVYRYILKTSHSRGTQFMAIKDLISSLESRLELSEDIEDRDEIMQLFPIAATNTYVNVAHRFHYACLWAALACVCNHSSTSTAYECAISLMQDTLTLAPTLETQHSHLVTMRDSIGGLPLDYASHLARIGQLKEAIEALERGRGLVWSEMRGLRTSIDSLLSVDPPLARKFTALNGDLEALTTSVSPMVWSNGGRVNGNGEIDPFGDVVVKQRKLLHQGKPQLLIHVNLTSLMKIKRINTANTD